MKETLIDFAWMLEKLVRASFYLGAGLYLGIKAMIILPQYPFVIWQILAVPAVFIAWCGGTILFLKVLNEPSYKELMEAKKRAASDNKILYEMVKEYQASGLEQLFRNKKKKKVV